MVQEQVDKQKRELVKAGDKFFWKPENEGDRICGLLTDKDKSTVYEDRMIYRIQVKDMEKTTRVNGTTMLDELMEEVELGKYCEITYKGEKESTKGQPLKLFEVLYEE